MAWVYEQKFDSLTDGGIIGQDSFAQVSTHGDMTVQTSVKYEGTKALVTNNNDGGWEGEVYRDITSTTSGIVYVAMRQSAAILSGGFNLYADTTFICGIVSVYDQNWYLSASANTTLVTSYSLNTWYLFAIEYDTGTDQCRAKWKVAGGSYSAWTDWKAMAASSGITRVRIGGYNDVGTRGYLWLDCITPTDPEPESTTYSKLITSKSRIKIIGVTKKETIRAKIKKISNKLTTDRARIKRVGITKKDTSRARIKILGISKKIQIKGRIIKKNNTKKETSRARILTIGINKKIQSRGRIKIIGQKAVTMRAMIEKTPEGLISARARIFNTINKKTTSRGRIKRIEDKRGQSRARIKKIESSINQSRARVKQAGLGYKVTSKARIKKVGVEAKITAKARIKTTGSRKATMRARLFFNRTKTISSRGRIKTAGVTYKQTSRGRIKTTAANKISSKGRIVITGSGKALARAKIKKAGTVRSITSRARMKKTISAGALTGRAKIRAKSTFKPLGNIRKQSPLGRVTKGTPTGR